MISLIINSQWDLNCVVISIETKNFVGQMCLKSSSLPLAKLAALYHEMGK